MIPMGMQFIEFYSEVRDTIPKSNVFLAKRWVNRAVSDIYQSRMWSFLRAFGYLEIPDEIGSGTFTTTNQSAIVTADATAKTALTGLTHPLITQRQIRFSGGPVYSITAFNSGTGALTLDREYAENNGFGAVSTGVSYQCYQCYYGPPQTEAGVQETDFVRFKSVLDPIQPCVLNLAHNREWLDMTDKQRTNIGTPSTHLCNWIGNPATQSALPLYEMWPHPTSARNLLTLYVKRGALLSADTDTLPAAISDTAVSARALWHAYTWAHANQGRYSELRIPSSGWLGLRKDVYGEYRDELNRLQRQDEETMKARITEPASYPQWLNSFIPLLQQGGFPTPPS